MKIASLFFLFVIVVSSESVSTRSGFKTAQEQILPTPKERLPPNVEPLNYRLEIQPLLDNDPEDLVYGKRFTALGKMEMTVECLVDSDTIVFHAHTLEINNNSIKVTEILEGNEIRVASIFANSEAQTYTINLETPGLKSSLSYRVYIEYIAPIASDRTDGLYLTSYRDEEGNTRYLTSTDFEADDARRAWPVFDEPNLKATWNVNIIRKSPSYHSISNVPLDRTEEIASMPGWVRDVYKTTPPLPSYLVALTVSDYKNVAADPAYFNGRPVRVWGPGPMIDIGMGNYAANISAQMLQFFEDYYIVPSGLEKMDKVSLKDFGAGAMENWGMNTYRESRLLFLPGTSTIDDKIRMTTTLSHEIAHQNFGNLVTMKWWNDIWLNEGFATYNAALGVHAVIPEYLAIDSLVFNAVQFSMQADANDATTHPLSNPAETEQEIAKMFSTVTYYKGASVIRMMNAFFSETIFKLGLKAYIELYRTGNAEQDDLFSALNSVDGVDEKLPGTTVKNVLDTWTTQSGFPVVYVDLDFETGILSFRQEKFSMSGGGNPGNSVWSIPITFYKQGEAIDTNTKYWLTSSAGETTVADLPDGNWILVNPTQIGYYRVVYSPTLLDLLISQLQNSDQGYTEIDALSRSALLDDSLNLGFAGYYDIRKSLDLTRYMSRETEYIPFVSLLTNMVLPYRMLGRTSAFYNFRDYLMGLIKPSLASLSLDPTEGETDITTIFRARLYEWACVNLGDADCVVHAKTLFNNWMDDPANNPISPDLRPYVYCTAIANGGDEEWAFLISQYLIVDVGSPSHYLPDTARINYLKALGCSKQVYRLSKLLNYAIDSQSFILSEHRLATFQAVAGNLIGTHLAFNFIRNNFETLERRFGASIVANTLTSLANSFNSPLELEDVNKFHSMYAEKFGPFEEVLTTAKQNIAKNIYWYEKNFNNFRDWLETTINSI